MSAEERFTAASKGQTQRQFFVEMHMSGGKSLPKKMGNTRPFTTLCLSEDDVVGWKVDKGGLVEAARDALPDTLSEADKVAYSVFSGAIAEKEDGASILLGASHGAK